MIGWRLQPMRVVVHITGCLSHLPAAMIMRLPTPYTVMATALIYETMALQWIQAGAVTLLELSFLHSVWGLPWG